MADLRSLHPDDLLFFNEVRTAMRRVAEHYGLPLRSVEPMAMPEKGLSDRLGDCAPSAGAIRLVMRATVNGVWCSAPRTPEWVWETAAHELAHLRYSRHGDAHAELTLELLSALQNQTEDHREKVLRRLVKMQSQRDDAAKRAKSGAEDAQHEAEAFAAAINRMLIEHELNPSDIDYARATADDSVIELPVNLDTYGIDCVRSRVAWQESLARIVARGHLCTFLLRPGSNQIWFVGTRSHATVAEYVFGTLVPVAERMSLRARHTYREGLRRELGIPSGHSIPANVPQSRGYREAWLDGFTRRLAERFEDARKAAVEEYERTQRENGVETVLGAESVALVRLSGALVKVQRYVDDKFKSRKSVSPLSYRQSQNGAGKAAGRAAADSMPIGRRAVSGGTGVKGLLR